MSYFDTIARVTGWLRPHVSAALAASAADEARLDIR
jgi:hypothetical protein